MCTCFRTSSIPMDGGLVEIFIPTRKSGQASSAVLGFDWHISIVSSLSQLLQNSCVAWNSGTSSLACGIIARIAFQSAWEIPHWPFDQPSWRQRWAFQPGQTGALSQQAGRRQGVSPQNSKNYHLAAPTDIICFALGTRRIICQRLYLRRAR